MTTLPDTQYIISLTDTVVKDDSLPDNQILKERLWGVPLATDIEYDVALR